MGFSRRQPPWQTSIRTVRIGDTLHFTSRVDYTGGSFSCVEASIERPSRDRTTTNNLTTGSGIDNSASSGKIS